MFFDHYDANVKCNNLFCRECFSNIFIRGDLRFELWTEMSFPGLCICQKIQNHNIEHKSTKYIPSISIFRVCTSCQVILM